MFTVILLVICEVFTREKLIYHAEFDGRTNCTKGNYGVYAGFYLENVCITWTRFAQYVLYNVSGNEVNQYWFTGPFSQGNYGCIGKVASYEKFPLDECMVGKKLHYGDSFYFAYTYLNKTDNLAYQYYYDENDSCRGLDNIQMISLVTGDCGPDCFTYRWDDQVTILQTCQELF